MPANRKYGLDHPHHKWSTLPERKALRWPNKSRLALCVVVNLEHMDWKTPSGAYEAPNMAGGLTPRPWPDYARYGHRDYGHRIGIFRVLDALEERGIKATVAMDAMTAQHYPFLVEHCLQRGCEIIAHGVAASRMITSKMTAAQERAYIKESIDAIAEATGKKPQGWFSPEYGESTRTPQLLAEAGIRYVCDWPNDEQPYPMTTSKGEMYSLPLMLELDDLQALWYRKIPASRYSQMLKEAFEKMYADGAESGRLLALNLHPWVIGQPYRIGCLEEALAHMTARGGVWSATGGEVVEAYRKQMKK
ncbi:MAG: hypothetical protein FJ320_02170 [SAR202 cluster bacterium]|nr:hypothetical protein [SAR202 cluster bacterium]